MTQPKKFWLPPNGHSRKLLNESSSRPEDGHSRATREGEILPPDKPQPEILPPAVVSGPLAAKDIVTPPLDASIATPLDLSEFDRQIRKAAELIELEKPEGWLDMLFGRLDHRIARKTERAELLRGYISACNDIIEAARAHQGARRQVHLDKLEFMARVAEAQYRLEFAQRKIAREDQIEEAKAREIIADYEAKIREHSLRGRPAPPPPPPPPAPKPEDPRAKERARIEKELERLKYEEPRRIQHITGGKPEADWTADTKDEVIRTKNMYADAREKLRKELAKVL